MRRLYAQCLAHARPERTDDMGMKRTKKHDCVAEIDALLAERGDCLQRFFVIGKPTTEQIAIATERKDSMNWKRGSSWLMASFCPFCGLDLRAAKATP